MTTEHVVTAMNADLYAPAKPVLLALALDAGHDAHIDPDRLAFLTGYDLATVNDAIDSLLQSKVIYPVTSRSPHGERTAVQLTGMPPER